MEEIIDYKLKEFLQITDINLITNYLFVLDLLKPLNVIDNPNYKKWKFWFKTPKDVVIKAPRELSFGDVTMIRSYFNEGTIEGVIKSVKLCSNLTENQILNLPITKFYGIINFMKEDLIQLSNMETNELSDDKSFDINLEAVNANGRMARFGVLNTIDSLAKEDILRWEEIEKLPYMTVFTKLLMDKEKADIQRELAEMQKRKVKQ